MAFLDETGATILADEVKTYVGNTAVAKEAGKGLSTNDYTTTEKNKLAGIANGANKTIVDGSLSSTSTNPVQNKVIYTEFGKKLDKNGDSKDLTNTFVTQDSTNVTQWTDVDVLTSAEKHSSIFNKISTMFKNIRYLYKMLGTADISTLGEGANIGTVTGAISKLNSDLNPLYAKYIEGDIDSTIDLYANQICYIFGHSEQLNSLIGYWCFVYTLGSSGYYSQIAIGSIGKFACRFYDKSTKLWEDWTTY